MLKLQFILLKLKLESVWPIPLVQTILMSVCQTEKIIDTNKIKDLDLRWEDFGQREKREIISSFAKKRLDPLKNRELIEYEGFYWNYRQSFPAK